MISMYFVAGHGLQAYVAPGLMRVTRAHFTLTNEPLHVVHGWRPLLVLSSLHFSNEGVII